MALRQGGDISGRSAGLTEWYYPARKGVSAEQWWGRPMG